jgi:hypothetical protein
MSPQVIPISVQRSLTVHATPGVWQPVVSNAHELER